MNVADDVVSGHGLKMSDISCEDSGFLEYMLMLFDEKFSDRIEVSL